MSIKKFIRDNFVLVMGISLPVLLMIGFMVASGLPRTLSDPPRYNLVFSIMDYHTGNTAMPVSIKLVVKDGGLVAQYIPNQNGNVYTYWKKLYLYDAKSQTVSELPLPYPANLESITDMKEEIVEALKGQKLSTTLQSPDGYELSYEGYSHSGLINELFWGGGTREPRLRKGSSSVRLAPADGHTAFYYNAIEFIGWVVP